MAGKATEKAGTAVAKAPSPSDSKALQQSGGALAEMFAAEHDSGFEAADDQAYAIPFLIILQSGSPQCKKSDGAYVKGAEEGMLFNTVTQALYTDAETGSPGCLVIPCYYKRTFIEWVDRDKAGGGSGGFRGEHLPGSDVVGTVKRDEKGDRLPNGNLLVDTRTHYVLIDKGDGEFEPAVISMSSTQIKKSRAWMSKMKGIRFRNAAGPFNPPMFANRYPITTTPEKNDQGSWFGWKVGDPMLLEDVNLFNAAKEFKRAVSAGEVKEAVPTDATRAPSNEDDLAY